MKKFLSLLTLALLLCLTLTACGDNTDTPDDTSATDGATTTESVETTPAPSTDISLEGYVIVRYEDSKKDVTSGSSVLYKKLAEKLGSSIEIKTDWIKGLAKDAVVENDELEILIGPTNRRESKQVAEELVGDSAYIIRKVDNKIVISPSASVV